MIRYAVRMTRKFLAATALASVLTFGGVWHLTGPAGLAQAKAIAASAPSLPAIPVYYSGCNAARAAGAAPIYRGQPGYREEMDGDDDGIACEPFRGGGGYRGGWSGGGRWRP